MYVQGVSVIAGKGKKHVAILGRERDGDKSLTDARARSDSLFFLL